MQQKTDEQTSVRKLFIPSLMVVYFSLFIVDSISGTFLLDVTETFFASREPLYIAITSQLSTTSSIASAVFALLLAMMTVRFNHKKLLVLGTLCVPVGALGCYLAPNYVFLQIFFALEGIGSLIVTTMAIVLIADILPMNKRPQATGWIMSGPTIAAMIGAIVVSSFFSGGDWRSFLLWYALPITLISIIAAYFGIPSSKEKIPDIVEKGAYLRSFKQVLFNKSAATCLFGSLIRYSSLFWGLYFTTFLRIAFGLDLGSAVLLTGLPMAVIITLGHIIGGYMANRYGRKNLTVITLLIHGATLPLIVVLPDLYVALAIFYSGTFIGALAFPAMTNLLLEQTPEFRGTIISINSIFSTIGAAIGAAIGGLSLAIFNYTGMFFTFAALILVSATIFFFVKDPCKNKGN